MIYTGKRVRKIDKIVLVFIEPKNTPFKSAPRSMKKLFCIFIYREEGKVKSKMIHTEKMVRKFFA